METLPQIALFAQNHLPFYIDRVAGQPSLPEMVSRSLNLLQENSENGFFLLIEGSRIDMAAHNNDAAAHFYEILMYNEAVRVVNDFVAEHPNTLVVTRYTGVSKLIRNVDFYFGS
jgi:alkaline phosphatase